MLAKLRGAQHVGVHAPSGRYRPLLTCNFRVQSGRSGLKHRSSGLSKNLAEHKAPAGGGGRLLLTMAGCRSCLSFSQGFIKKSGSVVTFLPMCNLVRIAIQVSDHTTFGRLEY